MFIGLNDKPCQSNEESMFKWESLDDYAAQVLGTEYEQMDTNKVACHNNTVLKLSLCETTMTHPTVAHWHLMRHNVAEIMLWCTFWKYHIKLHFQLSFEKDNENVDNKMTWKEI